MRWSVLASGLLIGCFALDAEVHAASLDGYVYLDRDMTTQFTSKGLAEYLNDLNQPASAALSGTHSVNGPPNFETPVTGDGRYAYNLQGPAESGQCFTTQLHVVANPSGLWNTIERTFAGSETVCVVAAGSPPSGGGGPVACSGNTMDPSDCNSPILIDMGRG